MLELHILQSISFVIIIKNNQLMLITNKEDKNTKGECLNNELLDKQEHQSARQLANKTKLVSQIVRSWTQYIARCDNLSFSLF